MNIFQQTQRRCDNVASSMEMKVSPTSVENIVARLKSDVVTTLRQRSVNVVTTFGSRSFLIPKESYLFAGDRNLRV